jgi:acetyl-CoA C-acetyltransferase
MARSQTVIVDGLRSPFGKLGGGLSSLSAVDIAAPLIKALLERFSVDNSLINEVILGQVIQAGCGQIPSRQAALKAGLPVTCESTTVNKVCGSGMRAVSIADLRIRDSNGDMVIAGGMESMSQAPYLLAANVARFGKKMGDTSLEDAMLKDGLQCPINNVPMIAYGSQTAEEFNISRQEQDEWALRSHQRALEAQKSGRFAQEILPFTVGESKKQMLIEKDEGPRADTSMAALSALQPAYNGKGTVTAGNAPSVNDGAAVLLLMSEDRARQLNLKPLAKIIGHAGVGQDVPYLATVPALATQKALAKVNLSINDIGLMEINEAFAIVAIHSAKMLGISPDKVNVNGGAIALGHPIGASGARILLTLAKEMKLRGVKYGAAAICSGTAQGDSIILSRDGLD